MNKQTEIGSHVERYNLISSRLEIERGEEVEYVIESDVLIMDDSYRSTIIINAPFAILRAQFDLEQTAEKWKSKTAVSGRDILFTMDGFEAAQVFIEGELFSIEEIKYYFSDFVLTQRRENELSKADAAYLFYEITAIFDKTAKVIKDKQISILDPEFQKMAHIMAAEMFQLEYLDQGTFETILGSEFVETIESELATTILTIDGFINIIWAPLLDELQRAGAKSLKIPTLSVVK